MTAPQLLFRVDANRQIGTGHFYRCLYLARTLKSKGANSVFCMTVADKNIADILRREGLGLINIPNEQIFATHFLDNYSLTNNLKKALLVVDSPHPYFYEQSLQETLCSQAGKVMIITFRNESHFQADIVHNQNLLALTENYSAEPHTQLLLGPKYIILDERYSILRQNSRPACEKAETLLIFFGGADTTNMTLKVLTALAMLREKPARIITVVGPLYGPLKQLTAFINDHDDLPIDLHVNTSDMPKLMAQTDLAITSGGINIWELACLGIPNIVISTSEREKTHTPLLDQQGACLYIGHCINILEKQIIDAVRELAGDRQRRNAMSKAAMNVVDGKGTERVVRHMMELLAQ